MTKITGAVVTDYQWDDDQVVAERDGNGTIVAEYAFYPGLDRPHSVTTGTSTFVMATETPGNVIGLMPQSSNAVSAQYAYKPFGAMERNDQTVTNSLRFQARPYDAETGLYYFRARYYDPEIGRFISEDPIGLDGGINAYVFEGNNPVSNADPYGLDHSNYRPSDCGNGSSEYLEIDLARGEVISYCAYGSGGVSVTGTDGSGGLGEWGPGTSPSGPATEGPSSGGNGNSTACRNLSGGDCKNVFHAIQKLLRSSPYCRSLGREAYEDYYLGGRIGLGTQAGALAYHSPGFLWIAPSITLTQAGLNETTAGLAKTLAHEVSHGRWPLSWADMRLHNKGPWHLPNDPFYAIGGTCGK